MTITGGHDDGDIVPQHRLEYILGCVLQALGGILWASSIASICALLTTADPGSIRFHRTMDELNHMMGMRGLHQDTQTRVRLFFIQARSAHEHEAQSNRGARGVQEQNVAAWGSQPRRLSPATSLPYDRNKKC